MKLFQSIFKFSLVAAIAAAWAMPGAAFSGDIPDPLPDPAGEAADTSEPVQVYVLLGQSNMLGFGKVNGNGDGTLENAVKNKGLYPYLVDDQGNWTERKDARYVRVMHSRGSMSTFNNEWLTVPRGKIGPELGIGHYMAWYHDKPVLILKSCIGNRSLGWDLLPPGAERFEHQHGGKTYVYPGYKDEVRHSKWEKGNVPNPPKHGWYAGKQYDDDIGNAKWVLDNIGQHYPGAQEYEVRGFFWWQGDKDMRDPGHADRYEHNLVTLIEALRKDFNAPDAKFVTATLGQTRKGSGGGDGKILEAMFNLADPQKHPDLAGDVAAVYTHPLSKGGSSSGHYSGNAETYMNVGEAMGKAMVELMQADEE
ncbi:MAG: sialate O-acetylesterase [Phycisphaeraceae bacterium]|nr:sialate O-acetylesterase [Phycisphaeraceae bacterium]